MRIAAIQHRLRGDGEADARALAAAASAAADGGASVVICPLVSSLRADGGLGAILLGELLAEVHAMCLVPDVDPGTAGLALSIVLPGTADAPEGLGRAGLVTGDSCFDPAQIATLTAEKPGLVVLSPCSQTDLQAEAMLEYAIALSDSLSGVIVVAECSGAEPLEPGHGGSAIVVLGDVLAEAFADDAVLVADVSVPFPQPEPREPLPGVPPLLMQRLAAHRGALPVEHGPDLS